MPRHLDKYTKNALWEVHEKKCFYCNQALAFKNMQVDHIFPSNAFEGHEQEVKTAYQLDPSFDFNSLDNFAPACQSCNTDRKRGMVSQNGIPIWLAIVAGKKEPILQKAEAFKHELSLDLPDESKEFFLSSPDFSLSDLSLEHIRKADIELYKKLAFRPDLFPFHLTHNHTGEQTDLITNLHQYERYRNTGNYYAHYSPVIALASRCDSYLFFFEAFRNAKPLDAKIDFTHYYRLLPAELLHVTGPAEDFPYRNFETIGDYLTATPETIVTFEDNEVRITLYETTYSSEYYIFQEVLQANFSGTADRESVIFVYYRSGGTFHYSYAVRLRELNGKWVRPPETIQPTK